MKKERKEKSKEKKGKETYMGAEQRQRQGGGGSASVRGGLLREGGGGGTSRRGVIEKGSSKRDDLKGEDRELFLLEAPRSPKTIGKRGKGGQKSAWGTSVESIWKGGGTGKKKRMLPGPKGRF